MSSLEKKLKYIYVLHRIETIKSLIEMLLDDICIGNRSSNKKLSKRRFTVDIDLKLVAHLDKRLIAGTM
jgi:hypothetical protein